MQQQAIATDSTGATNSLIESMKSDLRKSHKLYSQSANEVLDNQLSAKERAKIVDLETMTSDIIRIRIIKIFSSTTLRIKLKFLQCSDFLKKFTRAQRSVVVREMNIWTFSEGFFNYFRSKFENQFFHFVVLRKNWSENFPGNFPFDNPIK